MIENSYILIKYRLIFRLIIAMNKNGQINDCICLNSEWNGDMLLI